MNPAELQTQMIHAFARWMSGAHPGSSLFEAPGVTTAVVPASPTHSIPNSVGYDSHADLEAAYPELEERFESAGVGAWTVWVPEADTAAESFLSERGHAFDGDPAAMLLDLDGWEPPTQGDLDWDSEATLQELAELNDLAYGYDPQDGMGAAMRDAPHDDSVRIYRARVNDETASVLGNDRRRHRRGDSVRRHAACDARSRALGQVAGRSPPRGTRAWNEDVVAPGVGDGLSRL